MRKQGATALYGKASETSRVPFDIIRQTIDSILTSSGPKPGLGEAISRLAGPMIRTLRRHFTPQLSALLQSFPDVQPPENAVDLFPELTVKLVDLLAGDPRNISAILFLDDVQWLDESSLKILLKLKESKLRNLFVLMSARNDAASTQMVENIRTKLSLSTIISIERLPEEAIGQMVSYNLATPENLPVLTGAISSRSKGNPLLASQLILAMLDQGAVRLSWGHWEMDSGRLDMIQLADNAVQLILQRSQLLSPIGRQSLQVAAIMGNKRSRRRRCSGVRCCGI